MMPRFRLISMLVFPFVAAACSDTITEPDPFKLNPSLIRVPDCSGPATSLDPAIASTLPPRTGSMMPDDQWADLALHVPGGFAGAIYVDNKPVLMLTDPSQTSAARNALASSLGNFDVGHAEVQKARWNFAQLVDWYNYLTVRTPVWQTSGMVSGDKDESINRIRYGVVDAAARDALVHTLSGIALPCDLIAVEITGQIFLANR